MSFCSNYNGSKYTGLIPSFKSLECGCCNYVDIDQVGMFLISCINGCKDIAGYEVKLDSPFTIKWEEETECITQACPGQCKKPTFTFNTTNVPENSILKVDSMGDVVFTQDIIAENLQANALFILPRLAADPTVGVVNGAMYYNTTDNVAKLYDNGVWVDISTIIRNPGGNP